MAEPKTLTEIIRSKIRAIDDINHRIICLACVLNMTYNAVHYMPEKAEDYINAIPVCTSMLDRLQQNLDSLREDIVQTLYNFEQAAKYK